MFPMDGQTFDGWRLTWDEDGQPGIRIKNLAKGHAHSAGPIPRQIALSTEPLSDVTTLEHRYGLIKTENPGVCARPLASLERDLIYMRFA